MRKLNNNIPPKNLTSHLRSFKIWSVYKLDQWIAGEFWRMVALLGCMIFVVAILIAVVRHNLMDSINEEWTESLWLTLFNSLDAGVIADKEEKSSRGIMIFATIFGLLILSTLIGLISSKIDARLADLRRGRTYVCEKNHVLILGWNSAIFDLIREIHAATTPKHDFSVVILADQDNLKMMDDLYGFVRRESFKQAQAGIAKRLRIQKPVTRSGVPWDKASLELVRPSDADWILVLTDLDDPLGKDATTMKTLLALDGIIPKNKNTKIVASICSHVNQSLAKQAATRAQIVDADQIIARLLVQTCRQNGLGQVISDLVSFEGYELYPYEIDRSLVGRSILEFVCGAHNNSVVGFQIKDDSAKLLGEDRQQLDVRLQLGDKLWILAKDLENAKNFSISTPSEFKEPSPPPAIIQSKLIERKPSKVLIIGWNRRGSLVLDELDQHVSPNSEVTIFDPGGDELDRNLVQAVAMHRTNIQCTPLHIDNDIADWLETFHQQTSLDGFDYIIILDDDNFTSTGHNTDVAVARVILELRKLRKDSQNVWPRIVCEVSDERTRELIKNQSGEEFIASGKFVVSLMVQFALDPERISIYESIFDARGSEICTRLFTDYVDVKLSQSWSTVIEAALLRGEIAIGWIEIGEDDKFVNHLNPQLEKIILSPDSRALIIVLAKQ